MEKCWRRVARHIRTCSLAMDDGGRCLLDVIDDPLLLQSFLESGSDDNSKDPQDGTSSESAVESPQISRNSHVPNHSSSVEHVVEPFEQMGYSYPIENNGLLAHNATCSITTGLGVGLSFVVASSVAGSTTYQHASSSGATIHHIPSSSAAAQSSLHQPSPVPTRSVTPLSQVIKSPSQGPPSVHSMPPPSPLQQTRSPLPPHTPSPAPPWSPAPPVLSPATSRTQSSMPSISLQQSHNQLLQTSNSVTHFVQALATQQSISQKLSLQQQQLLLHPQVQPASQQSLTTRLPAVASPVTTTTASAAALAVAPPVVQIIPAQPNVSLPVRTSQSSVRPIQPKLPQQILPKPTGASTNQFVTPMVKQSSTSPASATQRAVGVGLQSGTGQLVIGQGQTGVFAGPQGTFVLNQIIPAVGQSPILIQNLSNLQGVQLTLRPPSNPPSGQTVSSSGGQNNATLIAALQGPNQPAQALFTQTKSAIHGQQTIVIPNNIAHAGLTPPNLNLTTSAIPSNSIVPSSQGQGFLTRSNIIFSPRVMAPNQGLQLQHIQTPQGPILALAPSQPIALPHVQTAIQNTALSGPQLAHGAVPVHGVVAAGQGVISGLPLQAHQPHTALPQHHPQQSLFASTTVPFTSHLDHSSNQQLVQGLPPASSQPITSVSSAHSTLQQIHLHNEDSSPKKPATPASKPTKVPSVNLEELLKEHGIVPENAESTPPPSPDSQSPQSDDVVPTQLSTCSSTANSPQVIATLQPQHQVVVEQLSQIPHSSSSLPQLKFALAQDGSVILQPHSNFSASKAQPPPDVHEISVSMKTKSLVLPVVTSPPVPVVSTVASSVGHSTLLARLNAAPAISVPDIVSSLALATGLVSSTPSSSTVTTTVTTTTSALIPITVQSLNVTSTPITCSQVSDAVTSFSSSSSVVPKQTPTSEISVAVTHSRNSETSNVGGSPCSSQNVQKRMNHVIFGLQSVISPSQQHTAGITVQAVSKVVPTSSSSSSSEDVCVENSLSGPPTVQKADKNGQTETCIVGVSDNSNAVIAPSHKVQTVSTAVPNQIFLRLQDEIEDLAQKNLSSDQQHYFQQLLLVQQKINLQPNKQPKCPRSRNTQSAFQNEEDKEPIYSKSFVSNQAAVITMPQKQSHLPPLQDQQQNTVKPVASHNIHLVNLLKQNSVHNSSARYIPPSATSAATHCDTTTPVSSHAVSSHMRVGSQHVAVGQQQHHPLQHQVCNSLSNDQIQQSQQAVMLRVQQSNQQLPSNASHSNVMQHLQNEPPVSRAPSVPPVSKTVLISKQLALDQSGGLNPDTKTPFRSKEDACRRLLNYHVFNSRVPSVEDIKKADQTFDMVAKFLLDKSQKMSNKYHGLLLRDSMRPCPTPERVMLERLFIQDETQSLECDKAAVADGKELDLPPLPEKWLKESSLSPDIQAVEEGDHLEAPVIDSCVEILSPQHGDDCERSPPTLKRISIKPDRFSDRELEEPVSKKRSKLLPTSVKMESSEGDWCEESSVCNSPCSKACETDGEALHCQSESVHCQANYPKDNREEDMMTKLRKELNISPLNEDFNETDIHVDFDPPSETGGLADFEPPVARTEESCDSTLLTVYSNGTRTNSEVKYDYMLDCSSEWAEAYANHASDKTVSESQAAVESILSDQHNPSDLDLSGIEGLDDHLDESQQSIPNGIPDDNEESRESELNYIDFPIFKQTSCRKDNPQVQSEQSEGVQDQMQSAIKSILELPPENCSYISGPETEANPRACGLGKGSGSLKKSTYEMSAVHYGVNLDADMGMTGNEPDAALDEAVRSILQN